MILGVDILKRDKKDALKCKTLGLLTNQGSLNKDFKYTKNILHSLYGENLMVLFSPQHGLFGTEQDNMKESPHGADADLNIPVFSMYSNTREPQDQMLFHIDAVVVDLFDVGTRVYTFIYTMALLMKKAAEKGVRVVVLDRPNPISGIVEGNLVKNELTSFVGMYPIPMRHGMTIGELANLFNNEFGIGCDLEIIRMEGYDRSAYYDENGMQFPFPSPNMPTLATAIVYPGQVIFEGTNISEGRGTTRPFEIFGAPFIHPYDLLESLKKYDIPGVKFNAIYFKPTFNKFAGKVCGGLFLHVTDRREYQPYITSLIILGEIIELYPDAAKFSDPPYEYEYEKLPFDIITGDKAIRENLTLPGGIDKIRKIFMEDECKFTKITEKYYLY